MKRKPVLLFFVAIAAGSLIGVGTALALGEESEDEPVAQLSPEDCESGTMSAGSVLTRLPSDGGATETATPQELADRYIEDAGVARDFPDVTTQVDQPTDTAATVTILSGDRVIGQLTYFQAEGSWATDTVQVCTPRDSE